MQKIHTKMDELAKKALVRDPELLTKWSDLPSFVAKYDRLEKTVETLLTNLHDKQWNEIVLYVQEEPLVTQKSLDNMELFHDNPILEEHKEYRKKQNTFKTAFRNLTKKLDEAIQKVYTESART